jgi:TPR repeat protein
MNSSILKAALDAQEKEDYAKAIELLTPLAKQEDAEAQFRLGDLYFTSADVLLEDSVKWLRLSMSLFFPSHEESGSAVRPLKSQVTSMSG